MSNKINKRYIVLGISILVLIITLVLVFRKDKLEPSNVGETIKNEDVIVQKRYEKYKGEDLIIKNLIDKNLDETENGYKLFPNKTASDIVKAFNETCKTENIPTNTSHIEQTLKYNSYSGKLIGTSLIKSMTAYNIESDEKLEVTVYTEGNAGIYATNVIADIRAEDWDRSNEIFKTFLTKLEIEDKLVDALIKSDETFETVEYNNSDKKFTLNIKRNNNSCCNTSLIITHSKDDFELDTLIRSEQFENLDELLEDLKIVNSEGYEYTLEFSDKTFGNDVLKAGMTLLNKEYIGSIAEITFKGTKGSDGTIFSEELNYKNSAISPDGELEIIVATNYLNGSISNELDINSNKEEFTDEEKTVCEKLVIDFLDIVDENCEVKDVEALTGKSSKNSFNFTDENGRQYNITYGAIKNAYMVNHMIEGYTTLSRSDSFETYK